MRYIVYISGLAFLLFACAKTGTLTGGKKDVRPPVLVSAKPPMAAKNVKPEKITIQFNEFVKLNNVNQELVVSPPLNKTPKVQPKGRGFQIELADTLDENTTYSFNFGNAVADLNEGNVLQNFTYVFSTGDAIDSMAVTGRVLDAYTRKPSENRVKILLYKNLVDTAFLTSPPLYVGQTDDEGYFTIRFVKSGRYKIYALIDNNRNLYYDMPNEQVAFMDSSFLLTAESFDSLSSFMADTGFINSISDTLTPDSASLSAQLSYSLHLNMQLFTEDSKKQVLLQGKRVARNKIDFIFQRPHPENVDLKLFNDTNRFHWYIAERNISNDTISYWITDTSLVKSDSLFLLLSYTGETNGSMQRVYDTAYYIYRDKTANKKRRTTSGKQSKKSELDYKIHTGAQNKLDIGSDIRLLLETPPGQLIKDSATLMYRQDTHKISVDFNVIKDTTNLRRYFIRTQWQPGTQYEFTMLPGFVTDIYGCANDTNKVSFSVREHDYYGILHLSLQHIYGTVIVQLLNKKGKVTRQVQVKADGLVTFNNLPPQEYTLRAIFDVNHNGKWDTGDFTQKRQPEKVLYMTEPINVRSNWEIEHSWPL